MLIKLKQLNYYLLFLFFIILIGIFFVLLYIILYESASFNLFIIIPIKIYSNADTSKKSAIEENRSKSGIYR
jgi:hypothetical protein